MSNSSTNLQLHKSKIVMIALVRHNSTHVILYISYGFKYKFN